MSAATSKGTAIGPEWAISHGPRVRQRVSSSFWDRGQKNRASTSDCRGSRVSAKGQETAMRGFAATH